MNDYTGALRSDSARAYGGVQEVADMLGVSRRRVFALMRSNKIRPIAEIDVHERKDGSYARVPLFHLEQVREHYREVR